LTKRLYIIAQNKNKIKAFFEKNLKN